MTIRDFVKLLRTRWLLICVATTVCVLGAVIVNVVSTPTYEASTRLFVSTSSGASVTEMYQGNLFSQQRVISYTELLTGETLAQRTLNKLDLDIDPGPQPRHPMVIGRVDSACTGLCCRTADLRTRLGLKLEPRRRALASGQREQRLGVLIARPSIEECD